MDALKYMIFDCLNRLFLYFNARLVFELEKEHTQDVTSFFIENEKLISGSLDGKIKFWDLRHRGSLQTIPQEIESEMRGFDVHARAPVLAW